MKWSLIGHGRKPPKVKNLENEFGMPQLVLRQNAQKTVGNPTPKMGRSWTKIGPSHGDFARPAPGFFLMANDKHNLTIFFNSRVKRVKKEIMQVQGTGKTEGDAWREIDVGQSSVILAEDGKFDIRLEPGVMTKETFELILKYLGCNHSPFGKSDISVEQIRAVRKGAVYLHIPRLVKVCDIYLQDIGGNGTQSEIPPNDWWINMEWAYENRSGVYDMTDMTILCEGDGAVIRAHSCVLNRMSAYFVLISRWGDAKCKTERTPEGLRYMVNIPDVTREQMECVVKYIYTKKFEVDSNTAIAVYALADKFLLGELKDECSKYIAKHVTEQDVDDVMEIAQCFRDNSVINACAAIIKRKNLGLLALKKQSELSQ
jgi:hypothetical protein